MRERQSSSRASGAHLRFVCAVAALVVAAFTAPAGAQVDAQPALAPARELWRDGVALYRAGDYLGAADRFDRAYELEHVPSLGIWVARGWSKGGSLLAALARYRELSEQSLPPDAPQKEWAAKRDAALELRELLPRIPMLAISVDGPVDDRLSVSVNGEPLDRDALGAPRMMDPGRIRISAVDGLRTGALELRLGEGEVRRVVLRLALPASASPSGAASARATKGEVLPDGKGTHLVSYVFMGVGGASLLTGVVFGFMALHDEARLKTLCTKSHCPAALASDIETYEAEKTIATAGILSGAALACVGATLYIIAPSAAKSGALGVIVNARGAGLVGRF